MSENIPSVHSLKPTGQDKLNNLATMDYFVPLCFVHADERAHFTMTALKYL